ncbi:MULTISPECIES: hypothetical protein [unclassified Microbacterium]
MVDWDPQNNNGVDHTMIVSNVDAQYRDLDTAITVENPGGTAHVWSIA